MKIIAILIRFLYKLCCLFPQKNRVSFLSRQSEKPFDFQLLEPSLQRAFPHYEIVWACEPAVYSESIGTMLKQIRLVATSKICIVDGYVPAVSIPHSHRSYCVQLWHAPGAIKKFGYQSLDTPAGRSSETAKVLRMHRGYDCIITGLASATPYFAEAFDVTPQDISPIGLPRMEYLANPKFAVKREQAAEDLLCDLSLSQESIAEHTVILYAPTFRKNNSNPNWLSGAVGALSAALSEMNAILLVASHPLQNEMKGNAVENAVEEPERPESKETPVFYLGHHATSDAFPLADLVITDYSAVAFEGAIAGKPIAFYVPDIEEYRTNPGLNIDPLMELPEISFTDADALAYAFEENSISKSYFSSFARLDAVDATNISDKITNILKGHLND